MGLALLCTNKHNYHKVLLCILRKYSCAPVAVVLFMMEDSSVTTNLSGSNSFGNIGRDGTLDVSVGRTNGSERQEPLEGLRVSLNTASHLLKGYNSAHKAALHSQRVSKWVPINFERKLSQGSYQMHVHLCGSATRMP